MELLKDTLTTPWSLMRILRLLLGMVLLVEGIRGKDWFLGAVALFLLYQAFSNVGCCGMGSCSIPKTK